MRLNLLSTLFGLTVLISCHSTNSRSPGSESTFLPTESFKTLETLIASNPDLAAQPATLSSDQKIKWQEDLKQFCLKHQDFCEASVRSVKKRDQINKKIIAEITDNIFSEQFSTLTEYSTQFGLKFFARVKKPQLLEYGTFLLRDKECKTSDIRHSLALTLEDHLPDADAKTFVQDLYDSNSTCPASRTTALSSYRAAMLRLLDQDCAKAVPQLEKVTASSEDYLRPRSLYWTWKCQSESKDLMIEANSKMPYFSYHRIMMENLAPQSSKNSTGLSDQTPIMMETSKHSAANEAARMVEKLLAAKMVYPARVVLEKIRVDRLQETEPEFQVYWAHLLHLTKAGIKKFQILSALINTHPKLRTKSVKNMLFPNFYFDQVEATSKKLDPWLVQSLIRQESAFDPAAKSRVGATGLMQLMPSTARRMSKSGGKLKDPAFNLSAGVRFLEILVKKFDGQVHLALAAYNAGPGKVVEWQKRYPTQDPMLFVDTIPYRETREYVAFILRNYYWYRSLNPEYMQRSPSAEQTARGPETLNSFFRMANQIQPF